MKANRIEKLGIVGITLTAILIFATAWADPTPQEWCPTFVQGWAPPGYTIWATSGNCRQTSEQSPPWCCHRKEVTWRNPNTGALVVVISQDLANPGKCSEIGSYNHPPENKKVCVAVGEPE